MRLVSSQKGEIWTQTPLQEGPVDAVPLFKAPGPWCFITAPPPSQHRACRAKGICPQGAHAPTPEACPGSRNPCPKGVTLTSGPEQAASLGARAGASLGHSQAPSPCWLDPEVGRGTERTAGRDLCCPLALGHEYQRWPAPIRPVLPSWWAPPPHSKSLGAVGMEREGRPRPRPQRVFPR